MWLQVDHAERTVLEDDVERGGETRAESEFPVGQDEDDLVARVEASPLGAQRDLVGIGNLSCIEDALQLPLE
jgi:hypothetical protein